MPKKINSQYATFFTVILLLLLSLIPLVTAFRYPTFLTDDSFITLTYVKNLAAGNGFVFNHPPAVLGTTTPLFAMIVALLALIFSQLDIVVIAVFFTALCWIAIIWTFFFFRQNWGLVNWQVCILALVLVGTGWIGFLGMEAYLFALLLILAISLFLSERYWLTGFVAGLLFLTRGEGVLVMTVLLITLTVQYWMKERRFDIKLARPIIKLGVGFVVPLLLWAIFAQLTFGSVLPNSLAVKQAQGQQDAWDSFLQRLTERWIPRWGRAFTLDAWPFMNFWRVFVAIGLVYAMLRRRQWLILVCWIALFILGYSLLSVSAYPWYQLPIVFVLNLYFALGIITIVELLNKHIKQRYLALGLSILAVALIGYVLFQGSYNAILNYQGDSRGETYTELSRWFREHTEPSDSIAYIEVGYLGYHTDNRIVDLAGLVVADLTPHVAEGDFAWGFWEHQPDYYVYLPDFDWALGDIRADPRFDQQYQAVATLPGPSENEITIFARIEP